MENQANTKNIKPNGVEVLKRDKTFENFDKQQVLKLCAHQPLNNLSDENAGTEFKNMNIMFNNSFWDEEKFQFDETKNQVRLDRYQDISPYTYNRVILNDKKNIMSQSYINADYIYNITDSSKQENPDFIATQGPIPTSYDHFWRMVWQENVEHIVMLCGLSEEGRIINDMYWPEKVTNVVVYDYMRVTCTKETKHNDFYWKREFNILNQNSNVTRQVTQWHAVGWPDRKVPRIEYTDYLEELLKNIIEAKETKPKIPVIVHCSAGVGRTGTFMSLYYLWSLVRYYKNNKLLANEKTGLSVFGTVRALREQRMLAVQTVEQYYYLYAFMKRIVSKFVK